MRAIQAIRTTTAFAKTWAVVAAVICWPTAAVAADGAQPPIRFNRDVRPILSDKCFFCHGPDPKHREADLRLDIEEAAKDGAIVAGKPDESELVRRITAEDADEQMPPADSGKKLSAEEIDLLKRWIEQGAAYEPYWAYQTPRRHEPPAVKNATWPAGWIDRFLLARLEAEGLEPSPEADRVTLIRRLSFDLVGLPPTPEEVAAFVADEDPAAYEKLVDRLLASEHYGERMAMYWLDLVRFADTVGYHGDQDHNISPYRDYVIDAFNDNLPFDRFTREQIAGDLLPDSGVDQKIASGYNRLLQTSHEGGVQPKEYLAIYAADRVRNVSNVWMGATMGCCQCHDHKYDPYTMKDFYSLAAFFADVEGDQLRGGGDAIPTKRPPEIKVLTQRERRQIAAWEAELAKLDGESDDGDSEEAKQLRRAIDDKKKNARVTMITEAFEPRVMRILPRGNWLDESGPIVQPAVPEFLGKVRASTTSQQIAVEGEAVQGEATRVEDAQNADEPRATRLDLANWLVDAEHGSGALTARVMANRFWYLLFGVGIAKTLDDFGGQGEPPVYPELLDNLAVEFVDSGWDVKHMMKLIVMSRAYRQSSVASPSLRARDPYSRLYARQSRYRLPAETVRDTALSVSGLLVDEIGGASVKPYQPAGYYRHLNFPQRKYQSDKDERQWRRGLYVHWQRQFLHPMLKAFDAPSREECTAERPRSNTPLAALALLNDPTFVEAARAFAARVLQEGGETDDQRLDFAFLEAVSRKPDAVERAILTELLAKNREHYAANADDAKKLVSVGLAPAAKDVDIVEWAAWTTVARAVLNMNETITRN